MDGSVEVNTLQIVVLSQVALVRLVNDFRCFQNNALNWLLLLAVVGFGWALWVVVVVTLFWRFLLRCNGLRFLQLWSLSLNHRVKLFLGRALEVWEVILVESVFVRQLIFRHGVIVDGPDGLRLLQLRRALEEGFLLDLGGILLVLHLDLALFENFLLIGVGLGSLDAEVLRVWTGLVHSAYRPIWALGNSVLRVLLVLGLIVLCFQGGYTEVLQASVGLVQVSFLAVARWHQGRRWVIYERFKFWMNSFIDRWTLLVGHDVDELWGSPLLAGHQVPLLLHQLLLPYLRLRLHVQVMHGRLLRHLQQGWLIVGIVCLQEFVLRGQVINKLKRPRSHYIIYNI